MICVAQHYLRWGEVWYFKANRPRPPSSGLTFSSCLEMMMMKITVLASWPPAWLSSHLSWQPVTWDKISRSDSSWHCPLPSKSRGCSCLAVLTFINQTGGRPRHQHHQQLSSQPQQQQQPLLTSLLDISSPGGVNVAKWSVQFVAGLMLAGYQLWGH